MSCATISSSEVWARALLVTRLVRLLRFSAIVVTSVSFGTSACIDQPSFVLDESATSVSPTTPASAEGDDAMVLVPATSLRAQGTLAPNAPGKGKEGEEKDDDDDEKKGGDSKDADSDAGAPPPAEPTITVPAFWIDVREVSARLYDACVAAGACTGAVGDRDCTVGRRGLEDHPATCVSIDRARAFCTWRGKRLIRNDEWTAASAGAQQRPYPWGADAPSAARLNACSADDCGGRSMFREADGWARTAPVGSFPLGRSPEGVLDLAGNVAEWVDVAGASIARGGSYADDAVAAISSRALRAVNGADPTVGFRCAKDP